LIAVNTGEETSSSGVRTYSAEEYIKNTVGKTTSTGRVCKGISPHAIEQASKRSVYPENVGKALASRDARPGNVGDRTVFVRRGLHVCYDNDTDTVITVIYKGKGS
jgi:hypothetical protein